MTFEQAQLIRRTYRRVTNVSPEAVGQVFYNRLFEIAPEVRPIFGYTALAERSIKLMALLSYVVSRLNNLDSIVEDATVLARHYVRCGLTEQHYTYVGQALMWTLERVLDSDWTPTVKDAWTACYTLLAETMIDATRPAIMQTAELYPMRYAPSI